MGYLFGGKIRNSESKCLHHAAGRLIILICRHIKSKNLFIARRFADTVRFGKDWLKRLITGWLWNIESGTVRRRKRPSSIYADS